MAEVGDLEARLASVLDARVEVLEAYLFGSRARGDAAGHSDTDVAIYVADSALTSAAGSPFGYAAEVTADLMAALQQNEVDLVILNRAPPLLYHRVLRDGIRLLSRDLHATTVREGRALSRYCDYVPQLAKIDAAVRQRASRVGP